MTQPPHLLASYWTLAGNVVPLMGSMISPIDIRIRAEAACRAGYTGLGLLGEDVEHSLERYGQDGLRAILDDNNIRHLELEVITDWHATGERRKVANKQRDILLRQAELLNAARIKVVGDCTGEVWPTDHMVESFSHLCDLARNAGTAITLEIYPVSNVKDLPTALAIVQGAGSSNGGLLLDAWHVFRARIPLNDIAAMPVECLTGIELADGTAQMAGTDYFAETINCRKLPGQGQFDLDGFIAAIRATGYQGVYGVEIVSEDHRALAIADAADRSAAAARTVLTLTPE